MLCTKAFGMGIDISDIDTVYHYAPTGNLSDYVQEIGRVARDKNTNGCAMTNFTDSDLKYIRMLNTISSIKQYQVREVLRKLYSVYAKKKKRNILISPETFSYLFREDNLENKVKTSLLLLAKDINRNFNVLVIRPKSMFTKNFVNVPREIEDEFINMYGKYAKRIDDNTTRIIPGIYKNGDIKVINSGDIYEVNMSEIWENYFYELTFPDFKRRFFNGELFKFTDENLKLSARLHLTLVYKKDFEECKETLKEYCNKLSSLFSDFKREKKFFKKVDFKRSFKEKFDGTSVSDELADIILDLFVADTSKNIGFRQNQEKYRFIQFRKSQTNNMELEYQIMNSNYSTFSSYIAREISKCKPKGGESVYSAYIALPKEGKKSDLIKLSVLLELFGLANYEMVGGKNNEIFVRINDPSKIKRLAQGKYKNSVLSNIEKNRRDSQLVPKNHLLRKIDKIIDFDFIYNEVGELYFYSEYKFTYANFIL